MNKQKAIKNIMLVDDDPIFNILATLQIHKTTPEVCITSFTQAEEALAYLVDNVAQPAQLPDLIFLDIRMPQMDGFEFLAALNGLNNALLSRIDIILLTSALYENDKDAVRRFPAVLHTMEKPLTTDKFRAMNLGNLPYDRALVPMATRPTYFGGRRLM